MAHAARDFDENRGASIFRSVGREKSAAPQSEPPWSRLRAGEMPPMMFQLRFRDGEMLSFAYSDVREIRCRDAGFLQIGILAMARTQVTIEGRHLRELANLLGTGLVRWIEESDDRDVDRPERAAAITKITIERPQELLAT